jgi:hypothetical protein
MNIPLDIDLKWIIGIVGAIATYIGYRVKIHNAKQQGKSEAVKEIIDEDLRRMKKLHKRSDHIRNENNKTKSAVPDNWDAVNKLREEGHNTFSSIATPSVRKGVRADTGPNKTTKSPSDD